MITIRKGKHAWQENTELPHSPKEGKNPARGHSAGIYSHLN